MGKIEHLVTTLKAIEEMPTKRATEFQFNALQFELLGSKVVEMREHLRLHADLPASSKDHCGPYFEELMLRIEKKQEFNARMLWQSDWVKKAVALGDFCSLCIEILPGPDWWCEVVHHAIWRRRSTVHHHSSDTLLKRYEGFLELLRKLHYVHIDICDRTVTLQELPIDHVDGEISGYFLFKINRENREPAVV